MRTCMRRIYHAARMVARALGITPPPKTLLLVANLTGRRKISREQIALLEQMRHHNQASDFPYKATEIWTELSRKFQDYLWWDGIEQVEQSRMNRYFAGTWPGEPKLLRFACWLLYQDLKTRDELGLLNQISAEVDIASGIAFEFDRHKVTWELLIAIDHLYSIREIDAALLEDSRVVVDLGAGWGRLGYVLKLANPKLVYLICDLPETLLISSSYLPQRLPGEKVHGYMETRQSGELTRGMLLDGGGIWFLGTQDLERLQDKSVDLFVNVASFQEMTLPQVKAYFQVIDRKVRERGIFYTLQLWKAQTHAFNQNEISHFEDYPFHPDWHRWYVRNASWSDLYFETAYSIL